MEKIQHGLELSIGRRGWETKEIIKRLEIKDIPKIPSLCLCGCNEITWNGTEYIHGHHGIGDYKLTLSDDTWYPRIPDLCHCNCNEIVWNGRKYVFGHQSKIEENRKRNSERQKGRNTKYFILDEFGNKQIFPKIPVICYCGKCNEICWTSNYKRGHQKILNTENIKIANKARIKTFLLDLEGNKEIYPPIPSLCFCGCNEIVWGGKEFVHGHHAKLNPPYKDKHIPEEIKKKISKSGMGRECWCKGKSLSEEHCKNISKNHADTSGDKNGMYIDGRSKLPYCEKWTPKLKNQVRLRDSYTCQLCGKTQEEQLQEINKKLSVHHIHYDKQNCYPDLTCLCVSCNSKVNKKSLRLHFESLFMNKLNERELLFWSRRYIK